MHAKQSSLLRKFLTLIGGMLLSTIWMGYSQNVEASMPSRDFVVFTPPKCGTHLLTNILSYMLGRGPLITDKLGSLEDVLQLAKEAKDNNQYLVSHSFTEEMLHVFIDRGYKIFFIVRDPRDQLISMMYWMKKGYWNEFQASKISDVKEQIEELITGEHYGWRCYEGCIGYRLEIIKALDSEAVHQTSFEALVGSRGNGEHDEQINEIVRIGDFVGVQVSSDFAEEIANHTFGGTWSFREGKIGSWKTHFQSYQISYYKALYSDLLIQLGYETGTEW